MIENPVDKEDIVNDLSLNLVESEREKHLREKRNGLTKEEIEMMIENAPYPRFRNQLAMKILGVTGCRPSDLRNLRVKDVRRDERQIFIRSTKTTNSRKIPYRDGLAEYLKIWLDNGQRDRYDSAEKSDYLIPGEYAEQLGKRTLEAAVNQAAENAGLQERLYTDAAGSNRWKIIPYSFRYDSSI